MEPAVLDASRLDPGATNLKKPPRARLRSDRQWQRAALRWLAYATTGLGLLMFAAMMLQSYTVVRSFRASDALIADFSSARLREDLAARAQELNALAAREGPGAARSGDSDEEIIKRAVELKLSPDEIVHLLAEREWTGEAGLAGLAAHLRQDAAQSRRDGSKHAEERILWQRRSYWLLLMTSNLVLVSSAAAFCLVAFYITMVADARRSEIRARRAVMDAERNRTSYLAAAGHDLRQPIQAIELFLSTLLQGALDGDTRIILQKIDAATASMKRMISGLLDIAKLDAGLVSTDNVDVDLDELLTSVRGEFEQLAATKGLTVSIPPSGVVVQTDPTLLESVLRNLLSNAVRYTETGGVGVRLVQHDLAVTITVFDTGIGIPDDKRDAIFQDYYRLHSIATEGLGLGLGIVRRLCALLHCELSVASAVAKGSEFSLTLPAGRRVAVPRISPSSYLIADDRRVTALLLEDNGAVRNALTDQLNCWDIEVVPVGTVAEARARIKAPGVSELDIVIADYHLPDDNGLRLIEELRRVPGSCPCLLITGASDEQDLKRIRTSGVPWLPKPLDLVKLRQEVQKLVAQAAEKRHMAALSRAL